MALGCPPTGSPSSCGYTRQARWHDGVAVTTKDVEFSYDELLKRVFGKVYLESWIESLEIVNDKEMVVHHRDAFTNSNLVALTWFPDPTGALSRR